MSLFCVQNQPLETDGNGKTTLEKWGKDPPDVTLYEIAKDLLSYFKKNECLSETGKKIEKKYNIKNEHDDCWPEDGIKRAWGKTQRMYIKSERRQRWAYVIMLQMVKRRLVYDECKQSSAQEDHDDKADDINQAFETPRLEENSEDTSQSNDELQIWRAAGGVEQPFAAGLKTSKDKLTEESGAVSESQLSASSSDAALSLAESKGKQYHTKSNSSETKNAALMNENKDTLVNNCEKRKSIDNHEELSLPDTSNRIKAEKENGRRDEPIYMRIPLSVMFDNIPTERVVPNVTSHYKLINGFPSDNDIRIRKFYTVSYNNETQNAEWVYEILNRSTLARNIVKQKNPGQDYQNGHFAAAANHKWCHEANDEASLLINFSPQHKTLNNGVWKTLEGHCRRMICDDNVIRNGHVYTGPIYQPEDGGQVNYRFLRGKAVPTHFFKVIIVENMDGTVREPECYMMPNERPQFRDLQHYRVNIEEIERLSGLNFRERNNPDVNVMDHIKTVTWQGEDKNGQRLDGIERIVRISS